MTGAQFAFVRAFVPAGKYDANFISLKLSATIIPNQGNGKEELNSLLLRYDRMMSDQVIQALELSEYRELLYTMYELRRDALRAIVAWKEELRPATLDEGESLRELEKVVRST